MNLSLSLSYRQAPKNSKTAHTTIKFHLCQCSRCALEYDVYTFMYQHLAKEEQ